jgi:putative MATE family efflux protein
MEDQFRRNGKLLDKKYREFFIPTVFMAMANTMSIVVDGIIVGNMQNANALAAVNLTTPIMMIYMTVAVLFGMGASTNISIAKGRRENEHANENFTAAVLIIIVLGLLFTVLQFYFLDGICSLLTQDEVLLPLVKEYVGVLIFGTPALMLIPGLGYCLRADGKAKLASNVLIIANIINLLLDMVYMGIFKMGISGSSLATLSGYYIGLFMLLAYAFSKDRTLKFKMELVISLKTLSKRIGNIISVGMPSAISSVLMTLKILCINTIVIAVAGISGMIAFSVCISCLSIISMFISGASQTMMPIVGMLYGEEDYRGIVFVFKRAFKVLMWANAFILIILELAPQIVLGMFGVTEAQDILMGVQAIRIFAISLVGTSISYLMIYYYMVIQKKKIASLISTVQGFVVVIPMAYLLSKLIGISGVWIAFSVAEIATMALILINFFMEKKRTNVKNVLLLNVNSSEFNVLDFTIRGCIQDAVDISQNIINFLEENNVEHKLCYKVGLAVEEIAVNTIKYGYKKESQSHIDIRIKVSNDEILLVLRDDGEYFNPTQYMDENKDKKAYVLGGIEIVEAFIGDINYAYVLGMNNTTISIKAKV